MLATRVIPSLLLHEGGLYKTTQFSHPRYVGDPINAIKIFNDKEVDELVVIDIDATRRGHVDQALIGRINREAFMPLGYGGGVQTPRDIRDILSIGYEKVVVNSAAIRDPNFISRAADLCGSQSVVVCIDVRKVPRKGHEVYDYLRRRSAGLDPVEWACRMQSAGAGEILLYSVDREGTFTGYDTEIIQKVAAEVSIPVIALGGASGVDDFARAKKAGASAVAAGSMFVFHGPNRAVLITYPPREDLLRALGQADRQTGKGTE